MPGDDRDDLSRSDFDEFWAGLPDAREQVIQLWSPTEAVTMFLDAWNEFGGAALSVSQENKEKA